MRVRREFQRHLPYESQSKPGTKMVYPEPCKELGRRISAALSGKGIVPCQPSRTLICSLACVYRPLCSSKPAQGGQRRRSRSSRGFDSIICIPISSDLFLPQNGWFLDVAHGSGHAKLSRICPFRGRGQRLTPLRPNCCLDMASTWKIAGSGVRT